MPDESRPTTYVAFLRGVNVGAHNRMAMDELRETVEALGLADVETYIGSGNVVFEAVGTDADALADDLRAAVDDAFGYDLTVMVRTREALAAVVDGQPFEGPPADDAKRYVTFLREAPDDAAVDALESAGADAERFVVRGREVYSEVHTDAVPSGRFTDAGSVLGVPATRRAWNVVEAVLALADARSG